MAEQRPSACADAGNPGRAPSPAVVAAVALAVVVGAALRNAWPMDMEWKTDEQWMYRAAQAVGRTAPWPWTGMPSAVGTPNPGMSVWIFVALSRVAGVASPVELARAVMLLNSLAIAVLAAFALRLACEEREPWLWATGLAAVNPGAVQLQRKIWAQSVLPFFSVVALVGWWHRRRRWGAFLWGAVGATLGQIHMSGLFFTAALAAWTLAFERGQRTRWRYWVAGSCLGGWPLLPWVRLGVVGRPFHARAWYEPLTFRFWYWWARDVSGFQTHYSLGTHDFLEWLRGPLLGNRPTFAVGALLATSVVCAATALQAGWRVARARGLAAVLRDPGSSSLAQNAALVGFGLLLTLAVRVHPHYLLVMFPLGYVALARAALSDAGRGRRLLAVLVGTQLALSVSFLSHVHRQGGAAGDYGVSYSRQLR